MLVRLHVTNYLLLDSLELDFNSGLTVVTGETGSGKSIIIDALMIVFGAKTSSGIIRPGSSQATFAASFTISNQSAIDYLKENDLLDLDSPDSIICRRVIDSDGKSKIYINGHTVTISQIRILGDYILDIHTQHSSITLLKADTQRNLLDEYCGIMPSVIKLGSMYKKMCDLEKKLNLAKTSAKDLELNKQSLTEQVVELSELKLKPDEWEELETSQKQLNNTTVVLKELDYAIQVLEGDESSLLSNLDKLHSSLHTICSYVPKLNDPLKILDSISIELKEMTYTINQIANSIEQNPERLIEIEERINQIFNISRKYKIQPQEISTTLAQLQDELDQLSQDIDIGALEAELAKAKTQYTEIATTLSKVRLAGASKLSAAVTQLLHKLAITGEFAIKQNQLPEPSVYGLETIEYQICFNKGMQLQPLVKAASGGELSRTALALYLLLSIHNPPEVIIFDEIDVGIGGKIAAIVGQMLGELGSAKQVICITHQPQTACFGNYHMVVEKQEINKKHTTNVRYVSDKNRIEEIARMLGGMQITDATLAHAKELLHY
jgi:DNA repair protein RecN (Recombination protein N)